MPQHRLQENHGLIDIKRFFEQPPLQYLGIELAVCWILDCLLEADSYPTALVQRLADLHLSEGYLQEAKDLMPSWQKWLQEAPALESLTINNMHLQAAALAR